MVYVILQRNKQKTLWPTSFYKETENRMCNKSVIVFYVILQRIKQKTVWSKWFYKESNRKLIWSRCPKLVRKCLYLTDRN